MQSEPPIHQVLCKNEVSSEGVLILVRPNLFHALEKLKNFPNLPIWVDTICINQTDLGEKTPIIPMIQDIYREAEQVLVWLGPEDHGSDIAIDALLYVKFGAF